MVSESSGEVQKLVELLKVLNEVQCERVGVHRFPGQTKFVQSLFWLEVGLKWERRGQELLAYQSQK